MPKTLITKKLPCRLTPDEIQQKAEQLAQAVELVNRIRDQRKFSMAVFRSQIKEKDAEIAVVSKQIATHEEEREVECRVRKDYKAKEVYVVRPDTGEVVQVRTMTAAEAQTALLDDDDIVTDDAAAELRRLASAAALEVETLEEDEDDDEEDGDADGE